MVRMLFRRQPCTAANSRWMVFLLVAGTAILLAAAASAIPVTFQYVPASPQEHVYLSGSFNSWAASAQEMQRNEDGVYIAIIDLAPGRYTYKLVLDNSTWKEDPFAPDGYEDDGFGGKNGIVVVPADVAALLVGTAQAASAAPSPPAAPESEVTGLRKVVFQYQPPIGGVQQVMLAGTFNDWNTGSTPMQDSDGDGTWEATIMLAPGDHQYKFVADGQWITDTNADDFVPDGFGGKNSVIHVDSRFESINVALGDGRFYLDDIRYDLGYSIVNPVSSSQLLFTGRAHLNDVEKMTLLYQEGDSSPQNVDMQRVGADPTLEYHRTTIELENAASPVRFAFHYIDGGKSMYVTPQGATPQEPAPGTWFVYDSAEIPVFAIPDWVRDGVIYQIFPERFYNGDPDNDPHFRAAMYEGRTSLPASGRTNGEYFHVVPDWSDIGGLVRSPYRTDGKPDYYSFYGGDIEGVRQKLPYLTDLGVTILYFNPLNVARSNHKYDPCDYLKVDPHFADDESFRRFVDEAHAVGIRIIVDMAFNHCGDCHFAFQDSWAKGPESEYYNWFEWRRWPPPAGAKPGGEGFKADDYYACWWGFGIHPDLNFDLAHAAPEEHGVRDIKQARVNQPLVDYVLSSADYWLGTLDIDGFRLDVPNEVPFWFWNLFRERVREIKPDAYLVGELWGNASDWIRPDVFDATMNYKFFRDPVQKFLAQGQGSAATFDRELSPGRWQYPQQSVEAMMNLVDSHDTIRLATMLQGNHDRQKLVSLFAMTYVGAPHIFYGGEIGLEGGKDPDCRRPFPWNYEADASRMDLLDFYKRVIALRHEHEALRRGTFQTVLSDGMLYGFVRETAGNRLLVLLNNQQQGATVRLDLTQLGVKSGKFRDLLNERDVQASATHLEVPLEGLSGAVVLLPAKTGTQRH